MRFIDNSKFGPPANWAAKVIAANKIYLATGVFNGVWKDLASELNALVRSDNQRKCWYSEIVVLGADIDVDHFRPKSNCKGLSKLFADLETTIWAQIDQTDRLGYPFLAFDWTNFRLANQHTNQGRKDGSFTKGKQDFFPLKLASPIAAKLADLGNEEICLLDPCEKSDAELLIFSNDGKVDASYPNTTWDYCRAKVTVEVYHLNFNLRGLVDARLLKWNECSREIEFLMKLYPTKRIDLIQEQQQKIMYMAKKEAEFSAVVIDCIRHYAGNDAYFYIRPLATKLVK